MAKNIEMLKRIKAQWDAQPHTVDMGAWGMEEDEVVESFSMALEENDPIQYYDPQDGYVDMTEEQCGTTRCLAGWAIHFAAEDKGIDINRRLRDVARELRGDDGYVYYDDLGAEILGLDVDEALVFFAEPREAYNRVAKWIEEGKKNG